MAEFQLPPLSNSTKFEHLLCDLFNKIENEKSYFPSSDFQLFGVRGQDQKGIDIISQKSLTVIQCKVKALRGNDESIRKKLMLDINNDLAKAESLSFKFNRLIFASTFRDDANIQEFLNVLKQERNYQFNIYYWGWDTITNHIESYDEILSKYYKQFGISKPSKFPEGALGSNLLMKNYVDRLIKRYGDWKQKELDRKDEKFNWGRHNKMIASKFKVTSINSIPVNRFDELAKYLQIKLDQTIIGKANKSKGQSNYSSFDEYLKENQ